jgi:hypothetical protein
MGALIGRGIAKLLLPAVPSNVLSETSWPTILPWGVTPIRTVPPSAFRKAHNVSPAVLSVAVDFLNSSDSDSPPEMMFATLAIRA